VHLVFDIFQGMGVAAAVGIRPFLPSLAAGALAAGDVEIHFNGTDYSFLQGAAFLLVVAVAAIILALVERRLPTERLERAPGALVLAAISAVLGALFFAGSLARGHYTAWPGLIGGVVCALIAVAATLPLLARVRARLDQAAAGSVPVYAEGAALLVAILSVLAPPVGPIVLVFLIWLVVASRKRDQQKFAGLRILR
jgi:cell division protein FtsW (lipid II flippase)